MQTCIFWHGWCFHCDSIFKQGNTNYVMKINENFHAIFCYVLVMLCLSTFSASQPTIEIQIWSQWLVKDHFHPKAKKVYVVCSKIFFLYTWHTCDKKHTYKKLKQNSGWWCIFLACMMPAEFIGEEDVGVDIRSYLCRIVP